MPAATKKNTLLYIKLYKTICQFNATAVDYVYVNLLFLSQYFFFPTVQNADSMQHFTLIHIAIFHTYRKKKLMFYSITLKFVRDVRPINALWMHTSSSGIYVYSELLNYTYWFKTFTKMMDDKILKFHLFF